VGSYQGELIELQNDAAKVVVETHARGELWGLAMHPTEQLGATVGDDKTLRLWDLSAHKMVKLTQTSAEGRSVTFSPDGTHIVVGCATGQLLVLTTSELSLAKTVRLKSDEFVSDVKYSPDGSKLAAGCHDNYVWVMDAATFEILGKCKGHHSYVTHVDWSKDGSALRSTSGAYELLYWSSTDYQQMSAEAARNTEWNSCTSTLGWEVQGVWPMFADGMNVNSVDRSHSGSLLLTSDDKGRVNLFRYPAVSRDAQPASKSVHSSHVTVARFSQNDEFVMSTGGNDLCVMQWKIPAQ